MNAEVLKNEEQANDMAESHMKQARLEESVVVLQVEKDELERGNKELRSKISELQGKVKKAEEKEQKMSTWYVPRLKTTI